MSQLFVTSSSKWKFACLIPDKGTYIGCGYIPSPGACDPWSRRVWQATNRCFHLQSMFLALPSSLTKKKEKVFRTPSQDGGLGKHGSPPRTTTAKITTQLRNNYHPELSENWAVWKFNNQGIKEGTFIQTSRTGWDTEQAVPYPYVVDKNQEGYLRSKESKPHTRPPSPGFQCQEDKSP